MKAHGYAIRNPYFTLLITQIPNQEVSRFGIVVGRRIGKAVRRNRLKRIFRELVRAISPNVTGGYHCIVYPKISVLKRSHQDIVELWKGTLAQAGLLS